MRKTLIAAVAALSTLAFAPSAAGALPRPLAHAAAWSARDASAVAREILLYRFASYREADPYWPVRSRDCRRLNRRLQLWRCKAFWVTGGAGAHLYWRGWVRVRPASGRGTRWHWPYAHWRYAISRTCHPRSCRPLRRNLRGRRVYHAHGTLYSD